jgi:Cys-rich repeat protein
MRWSALSLLSVAVATAFVGCGADTEIALLGGSAGDAGGDATGGTAGDAGSPTCTTAAQCPSGKYCSAALGRCVDCLSAANCETGKACNPAGTCAEACTSSTTCSSSEELVCDPNTQACVECVTASDCAGKSTQCSLGKCLCNYDSDCPSDYHLCAPDTHRCVECLSDANCAPGQSCDLNERHCEG